MRSKGLLAIACLVALIGTSLPAHAGSDPKIDLHVKKKDATGSEGETLEIEVKRHGDKKEISSVLLTTSDGSAQAGNDYVDADQTLTFGEKEKEKTVLVPLNHDFMLEGPETFTVMLSAPVNANLGKEKKIMATLTILDEDAVELSVADAAPVTEGGNAVFTVTSSAPAPSPISVDWATSPGTASQPADLDAQSGTVTIPTGDTTGTFSVTTKDDALDEPSEDFTVALSNPSAGAGLHPTDFEATGTIDDNDDAPTVRIANNPEAQEGGDLVYEVQLSGPSGKPITVDIETDDAPSQAKAPGDYTPKSETINFAPGETMKPFSVTTHQDALDEAESTLGNGELLWAHITGATNATLPADFTSNLATDDRWGAGFISDDDDPPTVRISNNPTVTEGGDLEYEVSLSGPSEKIITVDVETDDGPSQAKAPGDYTPKTETLTFAPGDTTKLFKVSTNDDALDENDSNLGPGELLWAHITGATNATLPADFTGNLALDDRWGAGFIGDNDDPPVVTMSNNPSVTEGGDLVYDVSLDAPSGNTVTVDVETDEGSSQAQPPGDYTATSDTLTFNPGDTVKQFVVETNDDATFDNTSGLGPGELLWAHITGATNATLPADFTGNLNLNDRWSAGFIGDNDSMPTLTMSDNPSATEGSPLDFTISLSNPTDQVVSGTVKTEDGFSGAQPPGDYVSNNTTYTIPAGSTSTTFQVITNEDVLVEPATTLGPGEHIWAHVLTVNNAVAAPDFTGNNNTDDLWALGFIIDND